jgi:hypothetical protein
MFRNWNFRKERVDEMLGWENKRVYYTGIGNTIYQGLYSY